MPAEISVKGERTLTVDMCCGVTDSIKSINAHACISNGALEFYSKTSDIKIAIHYYASCVMFINTHNIIDAVRLDYSSRPQKKIPNLDVSVLTLMGLFS